MQVVGLGDTASTVATGWRRSATRGLGRPIAMAGGLGFAIREGGRTVGVGTVTALLD